MSHIATVATLIKYRIEGYTHLGISAVSMIADGVISGVGACHYIGYVGGLGRIGFRS